MKKSFFAVLGLLMLLAWAHQRGDEKPEPALEEMLADEDFSRLDPRFAKLLKFPNLHAYLSMNNSKHVCNYTRVCVNKGQANRHFSYDPEENAFKLDTLGDSDISAKWQIRKYFPELNKSNSTKVSFQWEFKYGSGYLETGLLKNYKAYQLSNSAEGLMFEYQHRFSKTDGSAVALPTNRYYPKITYSESTDRDPLSSRGPQKSQVSGKMIDNWQPGGDTAAGRRDSPFTSADHMSTATGKHSPFVIRANIWTRVTTEFQFENNQMRVCIWMSDEETPPALVLASVKEPGKCFLLSNDLEAHSLSFQNWWLEMNSSQDGKVPGLVSWHKNFIVYKDASIPLE
ncbi:hypothetical protein G8764_05365 [Pseudomaricurvus alcaniphilus]|uniref:hypothetical protein n=1 Tax=Pseudomaricurvus alcaniphilus TaxID=1166482 RepID=UPI00140DDBA1|nr:hypothetical protein [Pseudomaricurvus alcaniphilus]NHN36718.1 hypothetical protein [Pseudomaricurvus alcaniphilus]